MGTGSTPGAARGAQSRCWEFLPFPGVTQEVGQLLGSGGSLGRLGSPGKFGDPWEVGIPGNWESLEGGAALAHRSHGDTKQRMLENLGMNSTSHGISGACLARIQVLPPRGTPGTPPGCPGCTSGSLPDVAPGAPGAAAPPGPSWGLGAPGGGKSPWRHFQPKEFLGMLFQFY